MEPRTLITIYIVLLVTTIVLVSMKRTHWGSIIGVAIMPIYFLWVLFDACRSKVPKEEQNVSGPAKGNTDEDVAVVPPAQKNMSSQTGITNQDVKETVRKKLQKADASALLGSDKIIAVAILYENPRDIALPEKHILATKLINQYKPQGWIPRSFSIEKQTPIVARQLIYGKEIREDAGLDTAGSNELLAEMLTELQPGVDIENTSAIAFSGESVALGQTFFAVLAK